MKQYVLDRKSTKIQCLTDIQKILGTDRKIVIIQDQTDEQTQLQVNWWHVLLREFARETGYSESELKEYVKISVLGTKQIKIGDRVATVTESSKGVKKPTYAELIERTYQIAAEAGIILPLSQ